MRTGASRRRMAVWASAALLCTGVTIAMAASPAAAKKKHSANPLAGTYTGTSTDGMGASVAINFTITKSGAVLWTAPTVSLIAIPVVTPQPDGSNLLTEPPGPCPDLPTGTVSVPSPFPLGKPTAHFPKGKNFSYLGAGGSPAGRVKILASPVFDAHNRFTGSFKGSAELLDVQSGGRTCVGGTKWAQATRVGRK